MKLPNGFFRKASLEGGKERQNLLGCEWSLAFIGNQWVSWVAVNNKLLSFVTATPLLVCCTPMTSGTLPDGRAAAHARPPPKVAGGFRGEHGQGARAWPAARLEGEPLTLAGSASVRGWVGKGVAERAGLCRRWGRSPGPKLALIVPLYLE